MLCNEPSRWKDNEIQDCSSLLYIKYPSKGDLLVKTVKMEGSG